MNIFEGDFIPPFAEGPAQKREREILIVMNVYRVIPMQNGHFQWYSWYPETEYY